MHHSRGRAITIAASLTAVSVLAACGSDESDDSATADEAVTDTGASGGEGTEPSEASDSSEDTAADDAGEGACELITEDEITEAFGEAPVETSYEEGAAASLEMCEWTLPAPDDAAMAIPPTLQLILMDADEYDFRTSPGGEDLDLYEDLDGLGDEAKWGFVAMPAGGSMAQLLVRDGDQAFHLNSAGLSLSDEAQAEETFTSFARSVMERR